MSCLVWIVIEAGRTINTRLVHWGRAEERPGNQRVEKHTVMMGIVEQVYQVVSLEKAREKLNCEHKTSWTSHHISSWDIRRNVTLCVLQWIVLYLSDKPKMTGT